MDRKIYFRPFTTGSMSEQHTQAGFLAFLVLPAFPFYYNRAVTYVLAERSSCNCRIWIYSGGSAPDFHRQFPDACY